MCELLLVGAELTCSFVDLLQLISVYALWLKAACPLPSAPILLVPGSYEGKETYITWWPMWNSAFLPSPKSEGRTQMSPLPFPVNAQIHKHNQGEALMPCIKGLKTQTPACWQVFGNSELLFTPLYTYSSIHHINIKSPHGCPHRLRLLWLGLHKCISFQCTKSSLTNSSQLNT